MRDCDKGPKGAALDVTIGDVRDCDRGAKVMLHVVIVSNKDIEIVNSTDGGTRLCELQR